MIITHTICALLAPTIARAAAFQWSLPEPTLIAPAPDNWSPATTAAPLLFAPRLFGRQQGEGDNTCAFLSGSSESSITCFNSNFVCATNTVYGVNGCCDPAAMNKCVIPTTCIASTAMSTLCTNALCSSDPAIVKCTQYSATECYRWLIAYSKTTMTQHGCTDKGFTANAQRSWQMLQSSVPPEQFKTVTILATPSSTPTPTPSGQSKPSIGIIVGATIGGCLFLSLIALVVFLVYRKRKNAQENTPKPPAAQFHTPGGMIEYNPLGFPTTYVADDHKVWSQQGPVQRVDHSMPHYPGMNARQYGVVEVDGFQRPVEAPNDGYICEAK